MDGRVQRVRQPAEGWKASLIKPWMDEAGYMHGSLPGGTGAIAGRAVSTAWSEQPGKGFA